MLQKTVDNRPYYWIKIKEKVNFLNKKYFQGRIFATHWKKGFKTHFLPFFGPEV